MKVPELGREEARRLWTIAEEAKAYTKGLIATHAIDCDWREGVIEAVHKRRLVKDEIAYVEKLRRDYAYPAVEWLNRDALAAAADPEAERRRLVADYETAFANPYVAASRGYIDDVIVPSETRPRLIRGLELLADKRDSNPPRKHGNIPL